MDEVTIYTDGACSGNPGPGGWCAILLCRGREKTVFGGEEHTTNNRMELTGAIKGLEALNRPCKVKLVSDSAYLVDAINNGWLEAWKIRGWKKADRSDVLNPDLWKRLDELITEHSVAFIRVKGHAGNEYNERCDRIAVEEREKFAGSENNNQKLLS